MNSSKLVKSKENFPSSLKLSNPKSSQLTKQSTFEESIREINFVRNYFSALQRGSPGDLSFIKSCLSDDPRKFSRAPGDSSLRSNMLNFNHEFPLYTASKNNHPDIIRVLHEGTHFQSTLTSERANHLSRFEKQYKHKRIQENCLQVAARWGNLESLQLLLRRSIWVTQELFEWPKKYIRAAIKSAKNSKCKILLKKFLPKKSCFCN